MKGYMLSVPTSFRAYLEAFAAVLVCALLGVAIAAALGGPPPVLVLLVAVAFAAWRGGRGPALAATAAAALVAALAFDHPEYTAAPHGVRVALMTLVGTAISVLAGSLHAARAGLRLENSRLQSFIRQLPAGLLVFDASGRVIQANDRVREILRHDPMSDMAEPRPVMDSEGRPVSRDQWPSARALRGESVVAWQCRYVRGDGTQTWLEASAVPIMQDGQIVGGMTMFTDIASQKQLAREVEESRARLQLAIQSANSGWFEYDVNERRSIWSPELEMLYGMAPGTYTGTHEEWRSRIHPDDVERAERSIEAAMKNGGFVSGWRVVLPDGGIRHVHAQGRVWMDGEGKPSRMAGINMDVTAQREAEERVREAEARLELALEASRMGRWHLDLVTGRMDTSATCRANFGRLPDEPFEYEDVVAAVHPEDRAMMQAAVQRALDSRQSYAAEYRVAWPDGTVRWIAARGRATYDEHGRPVVMDGVTIDFTARKRLEEELHAMTLSLKDADRRKDGFLAVLGHELRNPLAPMRNALEILRLRGDDPAVRGASLGVMTRQVDQLTRLVEELLDVSRIAQGKILLHLEPIELSQVMEQAVEVSEPLMRGRGHSLRVEKPTDKVVIEADAARLVQVFTNLLNNAAKYTDTGGVIVFSADVSSGFTIVTVRDNGIGIAHDKLASVFEEFSQIEDARDRSLGGLGLGLSVARRLVEMHGGTIAAYSDGIGRGSVFSVTLPIKSISHPSNPDALMRDRADQA